MCKISKVDKTIMVDVSTLNEIKFQFSIAYLTLTFDKSKQIQVNLLLE